MTVKKHSGSICGCSAAASAINTHEATAERMCFNYSLTQCAVTLQRTITALLQTSGKKSRDIFAVNRNKFLNPEHTRDFSIQYTFICVLFLFMHTINGVMLLSFKS